MKVDDMASPNARPPRFEIAEWEPTFLLDELADAPSDEQWEQLTQMESRLARESTPEEQS